MQISKCIKISSQLECVVEFHRELAIRLLEASIIAYQESYDVGQMDHSFEIIDTYTDYDTDTHVKLLKYQDDHIVAFQGSAATTDLLTDLKQIKRNYDEGGFLGFLKPKVHYGFYYSYLALQPQVFSWINNYLAKDEVVYITGHSLGGALATICALDTKLKLEREVIVYTFGSPRVGNKWFKNLFDNKVKNSFRVVNEEDYIPSIPPKSLGYYHVGTHVLIEENHNIIVGPVDIGVLEKGIEGWASVMQQGIQEHTTSYYKKLLYG